MLPRSKLFQARVFSCLSSDRSVLGRAEDFHKELQGVGLQLDKLQPYVEARGGALRKWLDPDHFRGVGHRLHVRQEKLHLEKLADTTGIVAEDLHASQTHVDRLTLPGEKLDASRAAVERCAYPPVFSTVHLRGSSEDSLAQSRWTGQA